MQGHEQETRGGWAGHLVRRLLHVGMVFVPWIYYQYGASISAFFHLSPTGLLWSLVLLVIVLEIIRLSFKLQIFGQRPHETKQISSFAWGAISLFLVLLFAPKPFAYPIVASCALGDPFLGELRRFRWSSGLVLLLGMLFIAGIWLLASHWFGIAWWWAMIMGPVVVAAERIPLRWIDDNATMQLIPLLIILLF